ncbi:MAG: hypothetical protein JO290_02740 [Sphingomonadaceae bacterium]|nr:hypothetical protein [Sphingomonadaceae bacterium]
MATGNIMVVVGDTPVSATVPSGSTPMAGLLPLFQQFAGVLAEHGEPSAPRRPGAPCRARPAVGPAASQPVPLAPAEARTGPQLVEAVFARLGAKE